MTIKDEIAVPLLARFRTQLFVLILLVFIPASILTVLNNFSERQTKKQNTREKAVAAAKLAAAQEEKFVKNAEQLLGTLTQFPFLMASSDWLATQTHLNNLKKLNPEYLDFGLIESNGLLFCSTVLTNGTMDLSGWSCFQRTVNTLQFSIGDFQEGGITKEQTLNFAYPALDTNGHLSRVVFASLDISRLRKEVEESELPTDATVTLLDSAGNVLARHPDLGVKKIAGKRLREDPHIRRILANTEPVFEMIGLDGTNELFAVASIGDGVSARLWVTVGIPTKKLFVSAERDLWRNIITMTIVAMLAFGAAYFYAEHFFLRPLRSLILEARSIAAGKWSVRSEAPKGQGELGELGRTFHDMMITLRKQQTDIQTINAELEQRVRDRTLQLEQTSQELEAFSYSVSHDLRAPLRHIAGFVDLLRDDLGKDVSPKSHRFLGIVTDSAKRMGQLIDELLVFAKMGRVEMQKTVVQTTDLVDEVIRSMEPDIKDRSIVWEKKDLPELQGDPAMLRQVFFNLISNAIKYSKPRDPAHIEIGCEKQKNEFIFFVRDNGVGFDMQFGNKLFGVFQRLHHADEFEGTGIGLANVRRIIQRHGGRTWAEGKTNEGATFYFSIPILKQ